MIRTAALALAFALLSSAASADTLVTNVNGIQVGPDGQLQRFRALTFGDDGKVRAVIQNPELVRLANITATIDGRGRTLLPGLIDAHGHVMGLGLGLLNLDVTGASSLTDLQQRLAIYARQPGPAWIVGRGWNQELWPDKRFPTAADLDAAVRERPVILERVDGHAIVANSRALKAAGITSATKDPVGGKIERDASGNPTGLLVDAAMELVTSKVPPTSPMQRAEALEKAQQLLLSYGLTAVADMGTSRADWAAMESFGGSKRLHVRIMAYAAGVSEAPAAPIAWRFDDRLQLGGVKLYADGALGSRGALLKQPYADQLDTKGLAVTPAPLLRQQAATAAEKGFQLAIHAIGDAANAEVIGIFEALNKAHPGDRRWRIEHFQIADPADIPRLAPAGIIASMQPVHQTSDRTMAEARLGPSRLAGAYAWQSVRKSGARLAFGSDFPVESPNLFPGLAAAVSRQDMNGQPPGGWLPAERLSFEQALHAFTRGAAYAGFAEQKIGALEPGKWADFILVDRDVLSADPQTLARTQVLETWIAGKKAWERPHVGLDSRGERGR